jgi:quercetin dioxygenase-like cupin family protein
MAREIENPATGERIVFRRTAIETGGELLEMDDFWTRPDHQTPEHIHPEMEERWEVIAGRVGFRIDGVERTLGRGETIVAPPGSSHTSWNVGGGPAQLRIQMRPALRWQEFVERLFALARDGRTNAEGELDPKALVALLAEFGREIGA